MAKILGHLGGKARAKRLSPQERKQIASLGGKSRAQSILAAKRIRENFNYLSAIRELNTRAHKVKRLKTSHGRLPGIY